MLVLIYIDRVAILHMIQEYEIYKGYGKFRNRTLTCRNASNENLDTLMEIQSLGQGQVRIGTASTAQVGIGANPNPSYF